MSTTSSKLYHPLKPLRKPSTSLSNVLDNSSENTPSQETTSLLFLPQHRYNLRDLPSRRLSTDTSPLNLSALPAILHQDMYDNTHNRCLLKHTLRNLSHLLISLLVLKPLHYSLLMLRLHFYQEIFSQKL